MAYPTKTISVKNPRGYRARRGAKKGYSVTIKGKAKRNARIRTTSS